MKNNYIPKSNYVLATEIFNKLEAKGLCPMNMSIYAIHLIETELNADIKNASNDYIEVKLLDVMSVMEGSYPDAEQRWQELKTIIKLQQSAAKETQKPPTHKHNFKNGFYCSECGESMF